MLIASLNANGLRACLRKGLQGWLERRSPDVLCLQEIRAKPSDLGDWSSGPKGWHAFWNPAQRPGYSGTAILARKEPDRIETRFGDSVFDGEGRWLSADFGKLTVVSLYLPSGSHDPARQEIKYRCMALLQERMGEMLAGKRQVALVGDYNIAHTNLDIKNWRANQKSSGFLPCERDWITTLTSEMGWVDVFRRLHPRAQRYTWWSQRGGARDRDVGWRIDYQMATPALAAKARSVTIDKEPRISDHAPLLVRYQG